MNILRQIKANTISAMIVLASLFALTFAMQPAMAVHIEGHSANASAACDGVVLAGGSCDDSGETGIRNVITTIIDVLSIIVGAISVIMIIIGGLRYVISSGDSSGTAAARNTIIYAIVGLVIVIFAQAIIAFVVGRVDSTAAPAAEEDTGLVEPVNRLV